jgi:hypothetical protein
MSNRHWQFVNDRLLSSLNDTLALRHGPRYYFKSPEASFDWDVEVALVKDGHGNKLREEYLTAWSQPSLVGPDETQVNRLSVRVRWNNRDGFIKQDVGLLIAATDKLLGSPLRKEDETDAEAPLEKTEQKPVGQGPRVPGPNQTAPHQQLVSAAAETSAVDEVLTILRDARNSRSLTEATARRNELQSVADRANSMQNSHETALQGVIASLLVDAEVFGNLDEPAAHEIVARLSRTFSNSAQRSGTSSVYKLEAMGDADAAVLALRSYLSVPQQGRSVTDLLKDVHTSQLFDLFQQAAQDASKIDARLGEVFTE